MSAVLPRFDRPLVMVFSSETYRASAFLEAASKLGVEVVLACDVDEATTKLLGSRLVQVDLSDPEGGAQRIVEAVEERDPRSVIPLDEAAVPLAAIASGRLGTTSNSVSGVLATRDKAALRRRMFEANVAQPRFLIAFDPQDAVLDEAGDRVDFPCVVKPAVLSASTGVILADSPEALRRAAIEAYEIQFQLAHRRAPLVVEEFLPGREIAIEAIVVGGDLEVLAVIDKPDPPRGPYFPERILVTPADLDEKTLEGVCELVSAATTALGIVDGPVHAEIRWGDDEPKLLEIAARTIGGLCSKALLFEADDKESLEEVVLRRALGDLRATRPVLTYSGVAMLYPDIPGRIEKVEGISDAKAVPNVWAVDITVRRGTRVEPLPRGNRYLGFIFARAENRQACISALREAESSLRFVIESQPVLAPEGAEG
ncbi:MAG: hypothetical protein C4318_01920 [Acidimicrobiia bacterium]